MRVIKILVMGTILYGGQLFACFNDYQCGLGNVCVKPSGSYSATGVCITPVDEFGNKSFQGQGLPNIGPQEIAACSWNSDCAIGFKCFKEAGQLEGICVK